MSFLCFSGKSAINGNTLMFILKMGVLLLLLLTVIQPINANGKYALLVGISNYNSPWNQIHGVNDVNLLAPILKKQGFKNTILKNDKATAQRIRQAFNNLLGKVKQGDLIYIHFSCHGQPFEDLSHETEDGWRVALVPFDARMEYKKGVYEGKNHIVDNELSKYVNSIRKKIGRTGFVYVILDACHSGGAARGIGLSGSAIAGFDTIPSFRGTKAAFSIHNHPYRPKKDKRTLIEIPSCGNLKNTCYIEACRAYQTNKEIRKGVSCYGPLSYHISQILKGMQLSSNCDWTSRLECDMKNNPQISQQNIVIQK